MSLLARLLTPRSAYSTGGRGPLDPFWYGGIAHRVAAGVRVNEQVALTLSGVWSATRLLAETVAQLPAVLFERDGDRREKREDHPVHWLLHVEPNPETDSFVFWEMMTQWLVNWGNAYAEIERDAAGRILHLWPIHPSRIPPEWIKRDEDTDELVFNVRNEDGTRTPIRASDMFHIVGALGDDGICGKGTIRQARESIGMGIATERYGARVFGNGATPRVVLKFPDKKSQETIDQLRRDWHRNYGGEEQHGTAVLTGGADISTLSFPPEDAQFLESRKFNVNDIARWYRVPPHMLGDLDRATFTNIESQGIEFVVYSLMPWLCRFERAVRRQLLTPQERKTYFLKFNANALLRGDMAARAAFYQQLWQMGVLSANMILDLEDMNPIGPAGDKHLVQLNLTTLDKAGEQPEPPKPTGQTPMLPAVPDETDEEDAEEARTRLVEYVAQIGGEVRGNIVETFQRLAAGHDETIRTAVRSMVDAVEAAADEGAELVRSAHAERQAELAKQAETLRQAARIMVEASLSKMLTKEAKAACGAAKESKTFAGWMQEFYGKHESLLAAALADPLRACNLLGCPASAETVAHDWCRLSRADLQAVYDTATPAEFEAAVRAAVEAWEGRAAQVATEIARAE